MRWTVAIMFAAFACGKGENAGMEEAKKQAEAEQKAKVEHGGVAKKLTPPVPGMAKLPCSQVIDAAKFQEVLGETQPITVVDAKNEKADPEAAASCQLIRGGKRPSDAEQKALIKQNGRLGVMAGDEICTISTYCWTIEDPDRFKKHCADLKNKDDDSLGFYACVQVVPLGEDDVDNYKFYDDDTKCIIGARGGPSNVDNALIGKCAKAAHDLIGPAQIAVNGPPPAPPAPPAK